MKRAMDLLLAAAALLLLAPLLLATGLAVLLDSGRPVLFVQQRAGRGGRAFGMLKFRSMVLGAQASGPYFTQPGDARITRVGRFIRRTSLDELPQLFNVLRGDMSLVGPRPDLPVQRATRHHRPGPGAAALGSHAAGAAGAGPALCARTRPVAGPADPGLDSRAGLRPRQQLAYVRHLRLLGRQSPAVRA